MPVIVDDGFEGMVIAYFNDVSRDFMEGLNKFRIAGIRAAIQNFQCDVRLHMRIILKMGNGNFNFIKLAGCEFRSGGDYILGLATAGNTLNS